MCSVVGCDSWRRGVQRFNLPEEPKIRITWIQFVAEANGLNWNKLLGHFNEALWNNITICREHFLEECFEKPVETDRVKLKPDALPTERIKSKAEVPVKTEAEAGPFETVSQRTEHTLYMPQCPSCGYSLQTTTFTEGTLITLTQQCPLCEYRNEFKRQITASETDHQLSTGSIDVTIKEEQTDDYPCDSGTFGSIEDESDASISERSIHLKSHSKRKNSKCDICGFLFTKYRGLQRHMVVHTGVKPYECLVCERTFNQQGHLKSHMRLHTGERPYKCQYCDKAFNHNVSLKSHVQRYHTSDRCSAVVTRAYKLARQKTHKKHLKSLSFDLVQDVEEDENGQKQISK